MKIGILTFHRAYNCGAMLQAWALKTVLERMGHVVEFPICNHVGERKRWQFSFTNPEKHGLDALRALAGRCLINALSIPNEDILRVRYKKFRNRFLIERDCVPEELDKYYDLVIVGSDQVWSESQSEGDAPVFFAENISGDVRKIAYAVSYGDHPLDAVALERVVSAVGRFAAISVREPLARQQLVMHINRRIDVTLDPTLLLDGVDYEAIATMPDKKGAPYLFMYTLYATPFFVDTARALAHRLGVKCVIAPCYQYSRYCAPKGLSYGISPDRLVGLARGAKYVLAGSFHGTVMGVLLKKPFLSLRKQVDQYESRPAALLNMMGCGNRLVDPKSSIDDMEALLRTNVSLSAYDKLEEKRRESMVWLKEAIG